MFLFKNVENRVRRDDAEQVMLLIYDRNGLDAVFDRETRDARLIRFWIDRQRLPLHDV